MMSMWAFDKFKYTENADVQVLGLPYELNSNLFLYIFLPRKKFALRNVVHELTGRRLLFLIARCKTMDVEVDVLITFISIQGRSNMIVSIACYIISRRYVFWNK